MKTTAKTTAADNITLQYRSKAAKQAPAGDILQKKAANRTGLPDALKTGIENASGYSMDDVRVHYNSPKPAQLQALAYTQGTDIHIGPGQEKHLSHEAWHVVQQKQGRVTPTTQLQGININDNANLEKEADLMGNKFIQRKINIKYNTSKRRGLTIQRKKSRYTPCRQ